MRRYFAGSSKLLKCKVAGASPAGDSSASIGSGVESRAATGRRDGKIPAVIDISCRDETLTGTPTG
jgi:hypothetical protein